MNTGATHELEPTPVPRRRAFWLVLLVAASVFFYTQHDVRHNIHYRERGVEEFNPTTEEAEELISGWERGKVSHALAYIALGAFGMLFLILPGEQRFRFRSPFVGVILFYLFWSFGSVLWSEDPGLTMRKLAIFTMLCLGGLGTAKQLRNQDVLTLVFVSMGAYVLIGLASELVIGSFRPWVAGYRFSGTCHPNGQALDCAFLFLAAIFLSMKQSKRKFMILVAIFALACMLLTRSRTAAAAGILAPILFWGLVTSRSNKIVAAMLVGALVSGVFLFQNTLLPILEKGAVMGRTDEIATNIGSLTGRTDLWREVRETYISQRPTLGYGYNTFWTGEHIGEIEGEIDFMVGSGHSAYLDLVLGRGVVGLVVYLLVYLLALTRSLRFYLRTRDPVYAFFGSVLLLALLQGLLESTFLHPSFPTLVSMVIIVQLGFGEPPSPEAVEASSRADLPGGQAVCMPAGLSPNAASSEGRA